jgi:hypothetical protein
MRSSRSGVAPSSGPGPERVTVAGAPDPIVRGGGSGGRPGWLIPHVGYGPRRRCGSLTPIGDWLEEEDHE